jgi:phosphoribosylformimino-5-aminoimidazole carboxamide ribotide isomerase
MIIFPAIDLREGRVVRLRQGDPAQQTVFGEDPSAVARAWAAQGAEWLHVVNLDGAFGAMEGAAQNLRRLAEIRAATALPIQFGGGLRAADDIGRAIDLGASRVVLGTAAVRQPALVEEALLRFGAERIVVGIDAQDGQVAIAGWQESSGMSAADLAQRMAAIGVTRVVYTDIARDGMLAGANVAATAALARASGLKVIASGGVASLEDIRALAEHAPDGIEGAIIGKALYSGAVALAAAIRLARGGGSAADGAPGGTNAG